jgi:hypothetical protein
MDGNGLQDLNGPSARRTDWHWLQSEAGTRAGHFTSIVDVSGAIHPEQLIEIATELAIEAKDNLADLERKLSAIETAKIEIQARLRTGKHALERLGKAPEGLTSQPIRQQDAPARRDLFCS